MREKMAEVRRVRREAGQNEPKRSHFSFSGRCWRSWGSNCNGTIKSCDRILRQILGTASIVTVTVDEGDNKSIVRSSSDSSSSLVRAVVEYE